MRESGVKEDEFEQVLGPVNQPEPRKPHDSGLESVSGSQSNSGSESNSGSREQTGPSAARAFSNQGDSFALGGGASAINGLPSQTKNGKAAKKHHTT
jgi:hypothetical protein